MTPCYSEELQKGGKNITGISSRGREKKPKAVGDILLKRGGVGGVLNQRYR